ncbi:hypothetical protein ACP70R_045654 [Stipagrostis hirtigluma subsp. patula]
MSGYQDTVKDMLLQPTEVDVPALFNIFIVLPVLAYFLLGRWHDAVSKKARASVLAQQAAEEAFRVETMACPDVISPGPSLRTMPYLRPAPSLRPAGEMLPVLRFFTGNKTTKRTLMPKSTNFGVLEDMLQDPCATPIFLPIDFLKAITLDFSEEQELGRGGYGVVYKGILRNGKVIAVKKLSDMHLDDAPFHNEVTFLIGLKHQNIVKLVGYCAESRWEATQVCGKYVMAEIRKRLLCFEYINNKSLDRHRSDFGMSRLFGQQQSRIITESRGGTLGYMAPEYLMNGLISTKSDIFSLGVIIIELMTGSRDYPQSSEASFGHFIENVVGKWRNRMVKMPSHIPSEICIQQVNTYPQKYVSVDPDPKGLLHGT